MDATLLAKKLKHWMWAAEIQIFKWRYRCYIVGCYRTTGAENEEYAYPLRMSISVTACVDRLMVGQIINNESIVT